MSERTEGENLQNFCPWFLSSCSILNKLVAYQNDELVELLLSQELELKYTRAQYHDTTNNIVM